MTNTLRIVILIVVVLSLAIPGVFAFWQYSHKAPPLLDTTMNKSIFEFKEFKGVYIKSSTLFSTSQAKVTSSGYSTPTLHDSNVDASASGGYVTYKITLHNNTDTNYWYVGRTHSLDYGQNSLIDTNQGITVTLKDHHNDNTSTFNEEDRIPPQTERDIYVTYSYGSNAQSACLTRIELLFDIRMDAVQDEFLGVLNDTVSAGTYDSLAEVFNQVYRENGGTTITTETHPEVFAGLFGDLSVNIDGTEKTAKVVIRRENLDNDATSGDNYSNNGPKGCEYTLYITVDSLTPGGSATVYAISYSQGASEMGSDWYQVGELYEGTAPVKADGTIDYTKWKATYKEYEIADGITYKVGAPNGDQYDIMNTMEQLISAVDQNIFNEIDNSKIFKKVYDIIQKHPGSTDPAVLGLVKAFEDAAIFYKNYNNGQEFKVVRDKYTRAEIIYALSNIQAAIDYYYQTIG